MQETVIVAFHDVVGLAGVVCILLMYLAVQTGKVRAEGLVFPLVNLLGALFILYSLLFKFNLSAVIIETSWVAISIIGLVRWWKAGKGKPVDSKSGS